LINGKWQIEPINKLEKQIKNLPEHVRLVMFSLLKDLEDMGPYQPAWPKYSPLKRGKRIPDSSFHCHLKRGKPTYVACWRIIDKKRKLIEVYYVGTHENAPY
jgi:hypothetical protein